mgnify:CR=1 FL=1
MALLNQGITPAKLSWAVTAGVMIATIPVFGSGTILCLACIALFRLNPAAVLLANQLAYPLQFVFFLPLLRTGDWLFDAPSSNRTLSELFDLFSSDPWLAFQTLGWSTLNGLVVWAMAAIPTTLALFVAFRWLFSRLPIKRPAANT